jgi:hypothetical protein
MKFSADLIELKFKVGARLKVSIEHFFQIRFYSQSFQLGK